MTTPIIEVDPRSNEQILEDMIGSERDCFSMSVESEEDIVFPEPVLKPTRVHKKYPLVPVLPVTGRQSRPRVAKHTMTAAAAAAVSEKLRRDF
jgi:hypothetical protein